jgi:hypothetical protein
MVRISGTGRLNMDGEPPLANNPLGRRKHEQLAKVTGGGYQTKKDEG